MSSSAPLIVRKRVSNIMNIRLVSSLLAAAMVSFSTAALADETILTLTGNSEHINVYNVPEFGYAPGSVITDAPFVETITIDPAGGGVIASPNAVASNSIVSSVCCAVSVSLTIDNQTFQVAGTDYSGAYAGIGQDLQALSYDPVDSRVDNGFYLDITGAGAPTSLATALPTTAVSETYGAPIDVFNDSFSDNASLSALSDASGNLYPSQLTISVVPEPATWALFILGAAMTGAVARGLRASRRLMSA